tara:strand:+ start:109 stop:267 length:159 start_codon:yes stop_codon:yes gene_type:complete
MTVPITVSVPVWMRDYIKENDLKPSKLMQKAIIATKQELDRKFELKSRHYNN